MPFQIVKLTDPIQNVVISGGLVPKGDYNNATDYSVGDLVRYSNASYVMYVDAGAGTLPTDDTKWMLVVEDGTGGGGGGGGHVIKEEGTPLTNRAGLNFVGAGITASDDAGNDETDVTLDADLNTIAGLSPTNDDFMVYSSGAWANRTPAQSRTHMGLGTLATLSGVDADSVTVSNLEVDNFKATAVVTEAEGLASSDNDTSIPTTAAVKDYVDDNFNAITYDAVVAATGGDYTTLGAALTAGAVSIFIKDGTYNESAITSSLAGVTIVGESLGAIVNMAGNNLAMSGADLQMKGFTIALDGGAITLSGDNLVLDQCKITKSATTGGVLTVSGSNSNVTSNKIIDNGTSTSSHIVISGISCYFNANYINFDVAGTSAANAWMVVNDSGYHARIHGNYFEAKAAPASGAIVLSVATSDGSILGNSFQGYASTGIAIYLSDYLETISNNYIAAWHTGVYLGSTIERVCITGNMMVAISQYGIHLDGGFNNVIVGNTISSTNQCIQGTGADANTITGNRLRTGTLVFDASSTDNKVVGNIFNSGGKVSDSGSNNEYIANHNQANSTLDISVPDEAYGSGWNGSLEVPTKNAVYDKVEAVMASQHLYLINNSI